MLNLGQEFFHCKLYRAIKEVWWNRRSTWSNFSIQKKISLLLHSQQECINKIVALANTRAKLKEGFKEPSIEEEDNFILSSQLKIDYLSPIPEGQLTEHQSTNVLIIQQILKYAQHLVFNQLFNQLNE